MNVKFTDVSDKTTYIGGKRKTANHIVANVRSGASRSQKEWDDLCLQIQSAWNEIVPLPKVKRSDPDRDTSLRSVIILGGMTAGLEAGFVLPPAGGDVQWMQDHWDEFQAKAQAGDEEFQDMVAEVKERNLLANGDGKTASQKLEEALGWGDSA